MIIGIDGNEANVAARVGVSWYVYELMREFHKRSSSEIRFKIFLRHPPLADLPVENEYFKYVVVKGPALWSQIFLPLSLVVFHRDINVFFSPAHYAPRVIFCPSVVTIHDLSFFYFPADFLKKDLYQLQNWTNYSLQRADKIIAVSHKTKEDIVYLYDVPEKKIVVIHNGFRENKAVAEKPKFVSNEKYFLYVGTLQPRKNLLNLIRGFDLFLQHNKNYVLYIAGRKGWMYNEIFEEIQKRKLENNVIVTDYISQEQKKWLFENAEALIAPGLYEGFGLPVLEAFASHAPVIASSAGALPEIAKSAAIYAEPMNPQSFEECFSEVTENKTRMKKLVTLGSEMVSSFSWKKTADETLTILLKTGSK